VHVAPAAITVLPRPAQDARVSFSYVPNNAYLVRASSALRSLGALPETQAVLPWEPYFKLDPALLALWWKASRRRTP
jgi:hypothetical protein